MGSKLGFHGLLESTRLEIIIIGSNICITIAVGSKNMGIQNIGTISYLEQYQFLCIKNNIQFHLGKSRFTNIHRKDTVI